MKKHWTFWVLLIGILWISITMLIAPYYNVPNYSILYHTTSELAAQGAPNAWIMRSGFFAYGLAVFLSALPKIRERPLISLMFGLFGVSMFCTGIYSNKPIDTMLAYNEWEDDMHSFFSATTGMSFSCGVMASLIMNYKKLLFTDRIFHIGAILFALFSPIYMLAYCGDNCSTIYDGVAQRTMFVVSFLWMLKFLPVKYINQQTDPVY